MVHITSATRARHCESVSILGLVCFKRFWNLAEILLQKGFKKYASQILKTPDNNGVGGQRYSKKKKKRLDKTPSALQYFFSVL